MQSFLRKFGTPITLLAILALLFFGASWGWQQLTKPPAPPTTEPCVPQEVGAKLTSKHVTVRVYNTGTRRGLAKSVATQLKNKGFNVVYTGNSKDKVTAVAIVGNNANNPEVKLVKGFFPKAEIRQDSRANHTVDVLLGNKFPGLNMKAPTAIPVQGGKVCLPKNSAKPAPKPAKQSAQPKR